MTSATPPDEILQALRRMGLLAGGETIMAKKLTGGVSSDIWRVDLPGRSICVKRALAKLNVAADWHAPVIRNRYEASWMRCAASAAPDAVPELLAQDEASDALAMAYLPPDNYPLWKTQLRDGDARPDFAIEVGRALATIHAATAAQPSLAAQFPTDAIFYAIRLEPYLIATGRRHLDRAERLQALVQVTLANKRSLVHGDVSPKNILAGPRGPVFLDAECAWWGDPAFDLAFCLNHLLLKCLWKPWASNRFLECFGALASAYCGGVDWEPSFDLEVRAAHLLPGLLLARVDGKSPVEYLSAEPDKARVRRVARELLARPVDRLAALCAIWAEELQR